jgi:5-formyltetrahydrofolate cyclo-ligase
VSTLSAGQDDAMTDPSTATPDTALRALKRQLRTEARQRRASRPEPEQEQLAARLVASMQRPPLAGASCVALFVGMDAEPRTLPLVAALADAGAQVLLPVVQPDLDLDWGRFAGTESLRRSRHGLLEPDGPLLGKDAVGRADVVVVPAFAVDPDGRRLGQGGGCYDRALRRVADGTPVLAVVYDDEVRSTSLPEEPHDRRVTGRLPLVD